MKLSAYDAEVYEALRKPDIFADLYNGTVFQGEQVGSLTPILHPMPRKAFMAFIFLSNFVFYVPRCAELCYNGTI